MEAISLKKLTIASILEPRTLSVPANPERLCVIYGAATGATVKPTKFNKEQKVLIGRFEAVRASDRQVFNSQFLYLPDNTYQEQIANMCTNFETGETKEISFGFAISFKAGASPTGYVFTMEPMTDQKAQDALADVRKTLMPNLDKFLPALAAPATPAAPAAAAAGSSKK